MVTAQTGPSAGVAPPARAISRRLVGRDRVIEDLFGRYTAVRDAGGVETVVVEGPAGIGKSRTVTAVADRVQGDGGQLLLGHCVQLGEVVLPYAPLVEMVAGLVGEWGAPTVTDWAGPTAPELARLLPVLGVRQEARDADQIMGASASRLFQALRGVLDEAAARRPLLVVVEDIQWADRSTLDMLSALVPQLTGPALLVVTQRTDEKPDDPRVGSFRTQLAPHGDQRVPLAPLSREEQAKQLSDILGMPPTSRLLDRVYARAEGNPFFAEELLALGDVDTVPAGVQELLLARLESLASQGRQVLRAASVVGRRVPYRLLEAVVDVSAERLDDQLRAAVDEHLLVRDAGTQAAVSFRHALLQEAVADSLLPGESVRLHRRVAEALRDDPGLAGTDGAVAGLLARHWYAAEVLDEALVASVQAAREAKTSLAFSESLAHYERAIELLQRVPNPEELLDVPRYWLLWSAAEVAHLAAEPLRAAELVRAAIALVPPDAPHHEAYLHERLGRYLWMCGDGQGSLAAYRHAVDVVPQEPTRWRAAALSGYSQILMLASRWEESEVHAREAIEVAHACGTRSLEGHARCNLGVDLSKLGRFDEALRELELALRIAEEEFEDVDDIARARVNLHEVLTEAGRFEDAVKLGRESLDVVDRLGLRRRKGIWCRCDLASTLITLGRHAEARTLLDEAESLEPSGVDRIVVDLNTGTLDTRVGLHDRARQRLGLMLSRDADRLLDPQLLGPLFEAYVEALTWLGDYEGARSAAEQGLARVDSVVDTNHLLPLLVASVRALVEEALASRSPGRVDADTVAQGESLEQRAVSMIEAAGPPSPVILGHLAELRAELGRLRRNDQAEAWAAVGRQWRELGLLYRTAYAELRAAEEAVRLRRRAAARDHLETAWRTARDTEASHLARAAEHIARTARLALPGGDDAPPAPYGITAREQEVLRLLAQGLTDRDVAGRLFISHRTVERHVSNLLTKLDVSRRAELVAVAHRDGLVPGPADE